MGKSTEVALAYCAGLIDGEGCISITRTDQRRRDRQNRPWNSKGFRLFLNMAITDDDKPLKYLIGTIGGKTYEHKRRTTTGRKVYSWYLDGNRALRAIKKLKDYLIIKKQEALIGIEFQNHINRVPSNLKYKFNPDLYAERLEMYNRMKKIKRNRAGVETKPSENESSSDSPNLKEILVT